MRFRLEWIDRCDGEPVFTMANPLSTLYFDGYLGTDDEKDR